MFRNCIFLVAVASAAQTAPARIKIDIDRTIGEVDPRVFGNFAEHLGRMIYGGIYDEGSALSDKDGYRIDVMDAAKKLGVSILRYPGGNFSSCYDWKDGIGPKDKRPVRAELAWHDLESNRFGTDEFLKYCERIGAAPYICINGGAGTVDDARHWVEYTNEARHTYWADQRRKNGREEPYKVKYWGLGNEIDGPWQMGHRNAEDYSKFALEAAKLMKWSDDSIKLIASGSSNCGQDWIDWNKTVLTTLRDHIDYISLHHYSGNYDKNHYKFMAITTNVEDIIKTTEGLIDQVRLQYKMQKPIYIAFDEYNVWYRAYNEKKLEEHYNLQDVL